MTQKACEHCGAEFEPPAKNPRRRTCSRSCAVALQWRDAAVRERRTISQSAAHRTPEARARTVATNHRRWARPGEREKLSQRNREAWADPATRERLSQAIRARQSTPEMRRFYSEMRKAMWRDPIYRARVTEIVRASHRTDEYRALFSALLRERWKDPVWREKWSAATRRRYAKAPPTQHAEAPQPLAQLPPVAPPSPRPETPLSAARMAEEDAIAAFLAAKGVTKIPAVGDPAIFSLPPIRWDKKKRRETRAAE